MSSLNHDSVHLDALEKALATVVVLEARKNRAGLFTMMVVHPDGDILVVETHIEEASCVSQGARICDSVIQTYKQLLRQLTSIEIEPDVGNAYSEPETE